MGVTIKVLREGDGSNYPKKGETLTMHYVGTLASDGSTFDSSRAKKTTILFQYW